MGLRLVVCARTRLYRDGLADALRRDGLTVLGTAADADACGAVVARERPDAVLLDASIADAAGAIARLLRRTPGLHVVALAVPDSEDAVVACVEAGAAAFVTVDESLDDLVAALSALGRGEARASPRLTAALMRRVTALASGSADVEQLTARELEIARLLADGLANKQIASTLQIEVPTVKNHVHRVLAKLAVERRAQVAPRLRSLGLDEPQPARD